MSTTEGPSEKSENLGCLKHFLHFKDSYKEIQSKTHEGKVRNYYRLIVLCNRNKLLPRQNRILLHAYISLSRVILDLTTGHFLYVSNKMGDKQLVRLKSYIIPKGTPHCFTFYYYLHGIKPPHLNFYLANGKTHFLFIVSCDTLFFKCNVIHFSICLSVCMKDLKQNIRSP